MITASRIRSKIIHNLRLAPAKEFDANAAHGLIADAVMELRGECDELTIEVRVPATNGAPFIDIDGRYDIIVSAEFPWRNSDSIEWVERDKLIEMQRSSIEPQCIYAWSHWRECVREEGIYVEKLRIGFASQHATGNETVTLHCTIGQYEEFAGNIPLPQSLELALQLRATANAAYVYRKEEAGMWENRYQHELRRWTNRHAITQQKTPLRTNVRAF